MCWSIGPDDQVRAYVPCLTGTRTSNLKRLARGSGRPCLKVCQGIASESETRLPAHRLCRPALASVGLDGPRTIPPPGG